MDLSEDMSESKTYWILLQWIFIFFDCFDLVIDELGFFARSFITFKVVLWGACGKFLFHFLLCLVGKDLLIIIKINIFSN